MALQDMSKLMKFHLILYESKGSFASNFVYKLGSGDGENNAGVCHNTNLSHFNILLILIWKMKYFSKLNKYRNETKEKSALSAQKTKEKQTNGR